MTASITRGTGAPFVTIDDLGRLPQTVEQAKARLPRGSDLPQVLGQLLAFSQTRSQSQMWAEAGLQRASGSGQREAVLNLAARHGWALQADGHFASSVPGPGAKGGAPPRDAVTVSRRHSHVALRRASAARSRPKAKAEATNGPLMTKQTAHADFEELVDRRVALGSLSRAIGTQQGWTLGVLGKLTSAEVRSHLDQKLDAPVAEQFYGELAQVGAQRLVGTVGQRIRDTLKTAHQTMGRLIDSPAVRAAWIKGLGSEPQRLAALTRLGLERDAAGEIARDPVGHDDDLVDGLQDSQETLQSMLFDVAAANFSDDIAVRMLDEHPRAASQVLQSLDVGKGSFLEEALGQLRRDGLQVRRYKAAGRTVLGVAASLITGGVFAGVGATTLGAGLVSGAVSATTTALADAPSVMGAVLTERQARLATGQGLGTEATLQRAEQRKVDAVMDAAVHVGLSFVGSAASAARNAHLSGLGPHRALSDAVEIARGVAVGESANAFSGVISR